MNNKIWVLSNPRTGSGYLCEILANLLQMNLSEFLAPWKFDFEYIHNSLKNKNFINETQPTNCIKVPASSKIHYDTFKVIFKDLQFFKEKIGQVNFIKIKRKNIIEHATSLYLAITIKKWRLKSLSDKNYWDKEIIKIDNKKLLDCFNYVLQVRNKWSKIDSPLVYYEDLIEDPIKEIKKVLNFLNLDKSEYEIKEAIKISNEKIIKQTHPSKNEIVIKLKKLIKYF